MREGGVFWYLLWATWLCLVFCPLGYLYKNYLAPWVDETFGSPSWVEVIGLALGAGAASLVAALGFKLTLKVIASLRGGGE